VPEEEALGCGSLVDRTPLTLSARRPSRAGVASSIALFTGPEELQRFVLNHDTQQVS
jgi:hypothetical protein